ncbi:hypothetical protein ABB37_04031 [Leptomonas pyrrhocoris]|uniref:Uncharacterized protein n=1 Tax=Leptomonas pyrrhocoris TaxID=157538 RepID=A0A0M9G3M3_LEPPY|nr:hypothetical protein ABB37_04031 [Leptomonas pyrrhocoris]XP_015660180.1 hypothetical protein ABB37_04031 [Leptomonas pyrrhocoris]KPA81740.1 hypothetical protein ABB37_04031 [Leptomonas pyrrhocoris]KPA81741.1 hypothetical protein ABB37_04031 [Leptomonas pyrrhocoris]|eukprot:XP_015660179.1 hypothetical protein ABB37_04031 [Leptomonas pyrrhocoris]
MSEIATQTFNSIPFYKGYLPLKEAQQAQSYVVLAFTSDQASHPRQDESTSLRPLNSYAAVHKQRDTDFPSTPESSTIECQTPLLHPGATMLSPANVERSPLVNSRGTPKEIVRGTSEVLSPSLGSSVAQAAGRATPAAVTSSHVNSVSFYLFHKRDVQPPPIRFYVSPKKVHRCFLGCAKTNCSCERIHFRPGAWRMRLDTLPRLPLVVAHAGQYVRLAQNQIAPTAGYFLALGLKAANVLPAVVPTMCRFNTSCRNGISCLYIHADKTVGHRQEQASAVSLRTYGQYVIEDSLSQNEADSFYQFLEGEGVRTVGDMQVLGNAAFDSLAIRVPPQWAEVFLTLSSLRDLDTKMPLREALLAFPRVEEPVKLPDYLRCVGDLLNLTAPAFAKLNVLPFVVDACSIIRARYELDETFNVIDLKREDDDSFFIVVTRMILNFRTHHAHNSWRKHDPTRPVVTSVLTFVDVNECHCHRNGGDANNTIEEHIDAVIPDDTAVVGVPSGSWCNCPRRAVIAVNYELSTPSGSRCSEQNAMGKLASLGVPTWGVREVFVHGMNIKKEANPLFPCGVCENMLQKVTKDVMSHYGGDVTLYMFDATHPRKIVFLTIPEISNRDGANFKKFVAEDLRELQTS